MNETVETTIQILSLVIAAGSALFSAFSSQSASKSARLSEKQLELSKESYVNQNRPTLQLDNQMVEINFEDFVVFNYKSFEEELKNLTVDSNYSDSTSFKLYNIGITTARNILIQTRVENLSNFFNSIPSQIINDLKSSGLELHLERTEDGTSSLFYFINEMQGGNLLDIDYKQKIPVIYPRNNDQEKGSLLKDC